MTGKLRAKPAPIVPLNHGLYLGRSPLTVPPKGLMDGRNFRIRQGRISNTNLGWVQFSPSLGTNRATTKVLLHFDGTDASTVIREGAKGQVAPYPNWTASGNAQLDTAQSKFGGSSLLLDGTGDFVSRPDGSDISLGGGGFQIDVQLRPAANGTNIRIAGQTDEPITAAGSAWYMERLAGNTIRFFLSTGSAFVQLDSTTTVLSGTFTHIRVTRVSNTIRLFVDGVLEDSDTFTGSVNNSAATLVVGAANSTATTPWNGWIDEFFMDIGAADYSTATFAPPVAPYARVLNGAVGLIENFTPRGFPETMVIATTRDLYSYDRETDIWTLRTPRYNVGTVDVSAANPAVVTDNTGTPVWSPNNIKPGDQIIFQTNSHLNEDANWYTVASVDAADQLTLTTAVTGAPLTNVSYSIRRVFSGNVRDLWDTDTFVEPTDGVGNDLIFVTNGVDPIITWDGNAAVALYQFSLGFKAKQLRVFKGLMNYGNVLMNTGVLRPTTFINSDFGKPLDVVNGLANEFKAHEGVDGINEMEDLGDNLVIYSERHVTHIQFVGDPLVFVFRQASTGLGPLSSRLIADFGDFHEFIGADSMYLFDGVSVTETSQQVWREVLRTRDASRQRLGFHHFDEENGDLIWAIPLTSDVGVGNIDAPPEEAFVEHYLEIPEEQIEDPHSRRSMPFLAGGFSVTKDTLTWNELIQTWDQMGFKWNDSFLFGAFPLNIMGDDDGQLWIINVSQFANGVALPSYVRHGRRALGAGVLKGLVMRIYPFVTNLTGLLTVNVYVSNHADGPVVSSSSNTMDLTLPDEGHFVTPYISGRFAEVEFRRDDGLAYELEGYDWETKPEGRR